ncbi:MAG: hypothetical protein ABIL45_04210 [candidate division WOR-3 bacterium]
MFKKVIMKVLYDNRKLLDDDIDDFDIDYFATNLVKDMLNSYKIATHKGEDMANLYLQSAIKKELSVITKKLEYVENITMKIFENLKRAIEEKMGDNGEVPYA